MFGAERRGGFTLLEVMVAIVVAALALTAGLAALSFARERTRAADEALAATLEAAVARDLLIEWISGAVVVMPGLGGEPLQGIAPGMDGDPNAVLILPTRAETPLGTPVTLVRLYIERDPSSPEQGLVAELSEGLAASLGVELDEGGLAPPAVGRSTGSGDESSEPMVQRVEIARGATGLAIHYLDRLPGTTEWSEEWPPGSLLPRAVELYIYGDPPDAVPLLLRHPIRIRL